MYPVQHRACLRGAEHAESDQSDAETRTGAVAEPVHALCRLAGKHTLGEQRTRGRGPDRIPADESEHQRRRSLGRQAV